MTSESSALTFKEALARYKASAANYEKPDKQKSTHERDAWMLRAKDGRLLAIARDSGEVVHGVMLAALFRQFALAAATQR